MSEFDRTLDVLRVLNRQLDEYERTHDQSLLVNLQADIKRVKPQLERVVQNPEYKSSVDADRFFEFKDEMKRMVERAKMYGVLGGQKGDLSSQPTYGDEENDRSKKRQSSRGVSGLMNSLRGDEKNGNGEGGRRSSTTYSSSSPVAKLSFSPGVIDLMNTQSIVEVRTKPVQLRGWLKKQGEDLFKVWKRRWFEQRLWKIEYFKSDQRTSASGALGNIEFASMQKIEILKEPRFGFHLCTEFRMFVLQAETQQELEDMVRGIVEWKSYFEYENKASEPGWGEKEGRGTGKQQVQQEYQHLQQQHQQQQQQKEQQQQPSSFSSLGRVDEGFSGDAEPEMGKGGDEKGSKDAETERKEESSLGASPASLSPRGSPSSNFGRAPSVGDVERGNGEGGGSDEGALEVLKKELANLRDQLVKEEKRGKETRVQLAEKEKQLISTKAMLDAATETQKDDRTQKKNLESDFTQMQTRYEVEKRTWKEERHQREEEAADVRREMASLMAAQRTTEDENNRLKQEMKTMEDLMSELKEESMGKKSGRGGVSSNCLSMRMANEHADELKKVKTELIILQQHEKEERMTRRQVEEERDVLQEKLEIETKKRERVEERRKGQEQELLKAKSELETGKRQNAELEGVVARLERNVEERTLKEANLQQQLKEAATQAQLAGKMAEKAKEEEVHDPELHETVTNLAEEAGFSSEQVGKVVTFMGQYLDRYCELEDRLHDSQTHSSEVEEEAERGEGQMAELRKEYNKLLKEYEAKDQYVNSLKARGGAGAAAAAAAGRGGDKKLEHIRAELENLREKCFASQSQVALLSHQLTLAGGEADAKLSAKEKTVGVLRKDLGEVRKQYQDLRQIVLLQSGASEVEMDELINIKQELFVNLAVFTKMNLAASGVHCNEHVLDLYEEAKDLDYREWKAWISARYQEGDGGKLQRDYTRQSSLPSYGSSSSPSAKSSSSPSRTTSTSSTKLPAKSSTSRQPTTTKSSTSKPTTTKTTTTTTTKSSSPRSSQPAQRGSGEVKKVKKAVKKKKSNVVELN